MSPFFLLSPYPISSFFPLSLSFYWILFSLSLFSVLTSIFFFSSITECLLVTEQLKLNMSTRRRREVLKSCGKKTYRCRQTEARFHTPDILPWHSESHLDHARMDTCVGQFMATLFSTYFVQSTYLITWKCNSWCKAWGNREDSKAFFCKIFPYGMLLCHSLWEERPHRGSVSFQHLWQREYVNQSCFTYTGSEDPD